MANREALRELQVRLASRLQAARTEGLSVSSWLAVETAGQYYLLPLAQSGEIFPLPAVQPVPYSQSWFLGVVNLRGGLYGGEASCANTGAIANPGNRDYYSRFDVLFPQVRAYLASDPLPMNGARPLLPPVNPPASSTAASAAPPAAGPEVEIPRDRQGAHRAGVRPRPQR